MQVWKIWNCIEFIGHYSQTWKYIGIKTQLRRKRFSIVQDITFTADIYLFIFLYYENHTFHYLGT